MQSHETTGARSSSGHIRRPAADLALILLLGACSANHAAALDLERPEVERYAKELVKKHKLDADKVRGQLASIETQQSILDAISRPAEKTKPWKDYRDIFITPERIDAGVEFWKTQERAPADGRRRHPGAAGDAQWASSAWKPFSASAPGKYRLLDALGTLAFDYPPRADFFRAELTQLFLLARDDGLDLDKAVGSYAGAMGAPQFIPSSYRNFAVDGDGDGRRDLFGSWDDVLASVANYFVVHKWRGGEPVVTRATTTRPIDRLPGDNKLAADSTVAGLRDMGLRFTTDLPDSAPAGLAVMEGEDGVEYWVAFHNFYVITRYNRSSMYALAVYQLGQAIGEAARSGPDGPVRSAD